MWWSRKKHPRVKDPKDVWIERTYDYVVASGSLKTAKSCALGGKKREGDEGMERAEAAEGAAWLQWRKVARKEHKRERDRR